MVEVVLSWPLEGMVEVVLSWPLEVVVDLSWPLEVVVVVEVEVGSSPWLTPHANTESL